MIMIDYIFLEIKNDIYNILLINLIMNILYI